MPEVTPAETLPTPPAPVLPYARDAGGLEVDRAADVVAIDIPPRSRLGIKHVAWGSGVSATVFSALVGAVTYDDLRPDRVAVTFCLASCVMLWVVMMYNQSARVEVTADAVRLTVTGIGLHYTTSWPRSQVTDVRLRFHGVRLSLRGRRRGGWIPFGNLEQQKAVCAQLREALGLPGDNQW